MPEPQRIFIVEDHPNLRKLLTVALEIKEGFEPCGTAGTAEDALRRIDDVNPKIILIDLSLPGMSGLDFIERVRRDRPGLTCIVLSGHDQRHYADQAIALGASGYILKGRPKELMEALDVIMSGDTYVSPDLRKNE